jgi:hypothetical protein
MGNGQKGKKRAAEWEKETGTHFSEAAMRHGLFSHGRRPVILFLLPSYLHPALYGLPARAGGQTRSAGQPRIIDAGTLWGSMFV